MTVMPNDLVPLPTAPWDSRPDALPLDVEECRTAIWKVRGNITNAASLLKISPERLRRFVKSSPRLSAEMQEAQEQLLDVAEDNLYDALTDADDAQRRDNMTKFVLKELGGNRGYGTGTKGITIKTPGTGSGSFTFSWDDGESFDEAPGDDAKVINHDE